jgi:SWI/SNF-related matrix-associated actin-dependent regulator 1 of chromatin subfamily A
MALCGFSEKDNFVMDTTIKVHPPYVYLECPFEESYKAHRIGWGTRFDKRKKSFKIVLAPETLRHIKQLYPGTIVVEGQEHIDKLKKDMDNLQEAREQYAKEKNLVAEKEREYKLTPYKHQLEGLRYLKHFHGAALFGDCGIGKTAITLWDIENLYLKKKIRSSSVLIVGKLMTLESGWNEDASKFTSLSATVLWFPVESKIEKKELYKTIDHGEKPEGKARYKNKIEYFHRSGAPAILRNSRQYNPKKHKKILIEWKEVGGVKYGTEKWTVIETRNIRNEKIIKKIKSSEHDIHIINHESILPFKEYLIERDYEVIIVDESTAIKNPKAKITKAIMEVSHNSKYRRILSGTPSPQGPHDLWSQFYFLDRGLTFEADYNTFLESHFNVIQLGSKQDSTFKGIKIELSPEKNTLGYIHERLRDRIFRCRLEDCVDLPPLTIGRKDVYLTEAQRNHYNTMSESFFSEIDGTRIEVTIALSKIGKLRQITGGFILAPHGEVLKVSEQNPKLDALLDFLSQIDSKEKVIIFAVFRCEIELLLKQFGDQAVAIYGGNTSVKQLEAQKRFKTDDKIRFLICQPQSAAYGVNGLTISRFLLFYSIDSRADCNYQAIKRIQRTGQKRVMFVYYLIAKNTYDEITYKAIYRKDKVQQDTINQEILRSGRCYAHQG